MRKLLTISGLFLLLQTKAQSIQKVWTDTTDSSYGFYTIVPPTSGRVQAILVLLDGFGGNALNLFAETRLPFVASANDILTVSIPTGPRIYADASIISLMNKVLGDVVAKYHVPKDHIVLGGFSSGGTIALRYTELCRETRDSYPVQPAAVFTADSPVDLAGLYRQSQQELKRNYTGWWLSESQMIVSTLEQTFGKPEEHPEAWQKVSPFNITDTAPGNERFLQNVAYRTYHDVDINWQIQNRRRSAYGMNMLNASELVNRLVLAGNNNATFIAAKIPGRRSNGQRHPHSWNIIDETDLIQWVREQLHFYPDHISMTYDYHAPANWQPEVIPFPIDFAPSLPYRGFEELRFAPGWGNAQSPEKWAYTLLWWLEETYTMDAATLQRDLETYFTGLTRRRALADKLDMKLWTPAKASVQNISVQPDDIATFRATINIFDAQTTRLPGKLYSNIHLRKIPLTGKTVLFFEVAAATFDQPIWKQLDAIHPTFSDEKK